MGDQVAALKQLVALSHSGAILVVFQIGTTKTQRGSLFMSNESCYWHDPESFRRLRDQVEKERLKQNGRVRLS